MGSYPDAYLMYNLVNDMIDGTPIFKFRELKEQKRARHALEVPKKMIPSREAFESLGFSFEEIDDDVLIKIDRLPYNWYLVAGKLYETYIYDNYCRYRGYYFYKGTAKRRRGCMVLCEKYTVEFKSKEEGNFDGPIQVFIKDNSSGKKAKKIGECENGDWKALDKLIDDAYKWLRDNYPDYNNPLAYWHEDSF